MPEIWMLSPEEFVGNWPEVEYDQEFENACVVIIESGEKCWSKTMLRPTAHKGYFCVPVIGRQEGNIILLHCDSYGDYTVVGGYIEETLWVDPGVRGKGLSSDIIIERFSRTGEIPNPVSYTMAGKAAHLSAHRVCVTRALAAGYRVPLKALHAIHRQ